MAAGAALVVVLNDILNDDSFELLEDIDGEEYLLALLISIHGREEHIRINNYFEYIVPLYSLSDFRSHFRMSRSAVDVLEGLLSACPDMPHGPRNGGRPMIDIRKQILVTIWIIGNRECLRSVADRFNITKSSVFRVYRRVSSAIANHLSGQFIKFPSGNRAVEVIQRFEEKRGFPGVLGAVDGCHIPVNGPRVTHEQYINRKGFHSLQLQVICDVDMQFTDVVCGYPGSVHDARVFKNSPVYQDAEANRDALFPRNSHIVGDSAYPLKVWVLTPYRDRGNLTRRQRRYNFAHSSTRMVVERSLALLKGRFRKLKTQMKVDRIQDAPVIIVAACVLHNICLLVSDDDIEDFMDDCSDDDDDDDDGDNANNCLPQAGAADKRGDIMRNLP